MSWFTNVFKTIIGRVIITPSGKSRTEAVFAKAADIVSIALPIVASIAEATPNRTDSEIRKVTDRFGVTGQVDHTLQDKSTLLRDVAVAAVSAALPFGTAQSLVKMGIEVAFQVFKANVESKAK